MNKLKQILSSARMETLRRGNWKPAAKALATEYVKFNVAGFCGFITGTVSFFLLSLFLGPGAAWFFATGLGGITHFCLAHILVYAKHLPEDRGPQS